jgi:hypothetical protein
MFLSQNHGDVKPTTVSQPDEEVDTDFDSDSDYSEFTWPLSQFQPSSVNTCQTDLLICVTHQLEACPPSMHHT